MYENGPQWQCRKCNNEERGAGRGSCGAGGAALPGVGHYFREDNAENFAFGIDFLIALAQSSRTIEYGVRMCENRVRTNADGEREISSNTFTVQQRVSNMHNQNNGCFYAILMCRLLCIIR